MGTGTSLGRVRGLGSAKEGTHHWWRQRITAGSSLFLMLWLVASILNRSSFDYVSLHGWLQSAWVAIPMALLVLSVFYHFRLGLQVVIEDYQHDETRIVALVLLNFFTVGLGAVAIFAILKIAFGASH
ncbi:succinate dehydrogenase subunit D [Sphingomonas gellani]|uniref:Succinate dehydrogenase hydrophobic membrane anchor subunit n=1 Tax=Sphingomonas gellani TaxID=1166340 RepID=A0A1H8BBR4_9SPHN|nr:succinate dehydrogenase, hydrophobic membrane anchor protein [Sphingomonas gellani]SEM80380.1 succinate dehydrogenase subunit D [Sphingomonas gellani]